MKSLPPACLVLVALLASCSYPLPTTAPSQSLDATQATSTTPVTTSSVPPTPKPSPTARPTATVADLALLPAGLYPVTESGNNLVVRNMEGAEVGLIRAPRHSNAEISPDASLVALDNPLALLNLTTGEVTEISAPFPGLDPSWSPHQESLAVFSSEGPEDWASIYVLDLATWKYIRLTRYPGLETGPAWSPDGNWIAFESDHTQPMRGLTDIFILDAECIAEGACDTSIRLIAQSAHSPTWSPDSKRLAFICAAESATPGLCVVEVATLENHPVIQSADILGPKWSPDGQWIGYTRHTSTDRAFAIHVEDGTEIPLSPANQDEPFAFWLALLQD